MRTIPAFLLLLAVLTGCSTAKTPTVAVEPIREPVVLGVHPEAPPIELETAFKVGKGIGHVAGVLAAIFGGPGSESLDDALDRYRRVRDAAVVTAVIIGATQAAAAAEAVEAEPVLARERAALQQLDFVRVTQPYPDQLEVRFTTPPTREMLAEVVEIVSGGESLTFTVEGPGSLLLDVRESLIVLGLPSSAVSAHRTEGAGEVVLRIRHGR